jgi:hypothetical protein
MHGREMGRDEQMESSKHSNVMCDGGRLFITALGVDDTRTETDTGLSKSPCVISQGNLLVSVLPRSIPKTSELRDSISKVRLGQSES